MGGADTRTLELVSELTAAIGREIAARDPLDAIPWPDLPNVEAMTLHIGNTHRWVSAVVRSRRAVVATTPSTDAADWYMEGRTELLNALTATPPHDPCWVLGKRAGNVGFWGRRMIFENVKHLMDLRASGGQSWVAAGELSTVEYADGIDELFDVFLPRSRPRLNPLPAPVVLRAGDSDRQWHIDRDWNVSSSALTPPQSTAAQISAHTSDLALALWERADLRDQHRFRRSGHPATVETLASTHIHPW